MELCHINENVYYIKSTVNIGVITSLTGNALVIDAGIDESAGRKINRIINEAGFKITGLLLTHAHADHYGGAAYLIKSTGACVYASTIEKAVLEYPLWEPLYLSCGAFPEPSLRSKFFMGQAVKVDEVIKPGPQVLGDWELEILDLAGHSLGQVGVAAGDTLFCADSVISSDFIAKHGIPLNSDLEQTLKTYDLLLQRKERYYLPSHGTLVNEVKELVEVNQNRIFSVLETVVQETTRPQTLDEIISKVSLKYNIGIAQAGQYALTRLTLMAYLNYLIEKGRIRAIYEDRTERFANTD